MACQREGGPTCCGPLRERQNEKKAMTTARGPIAGESPMNEWQTAVSCNIVRLSALNYQGPFCYLSIARPIGSTGHTISSRKFESA